MHPETEAKPEVKDIGVQCDLLLPIPMSLPLTSTPIKDAADFYEADFDTTTTEDEIDDTYEPSDSEENVTM